MQFSRSLSKNIDAFEFVDVTFTGFISNSFHDCVAIYGNND